ncbi:MAG: alpha/beta fold hydrolase [Cognatishimia sp.]
MADLKNIVHLNAAQRGPVDAPPMVFLHTIGTDSSLWSQVIDLLPQNLHVICLDLRGHGQTDCPTPPFAMGALIKDVETALDELNIRDSIVVGLGMGGLIAQGLAIKRLDQVRALVLCGSAAKMGFAPHWEADIAETMANGPGFICQKMMRAWFSRQALADDAHLVWQSLFLTTPTDALLGSMHAIKGADFYTPTSGLRLPTLGICGSEDGVAPPDLMRETLALIPASDFKILRKAGHLSCVDQPAAFAQLVTEFIQRIGHL